MNHDIDSTQPRDRGTTTTCQSCGRNIGKDNKCCPLCGKHVNHPRIILVDASMVRPREQRDRDPSRPRHCLDCGAPLRAGKCRLCGKDFSEARLGVEE